jgi:isocitrate lyase
MVAVLKFSTSVMVDAKFHFADAELKFSRHIGVKAGHCLFPKNTHTQVLLAFRLPLCIMTTSFALFKLLS